MELDTTRGPHSTGAYLVPRFGSQHCEPVLAKELGTPWLLYQTADWKRGWERVLKVMLGHNRWATRGKVAASNAHPFEFARVAGAHNGTLRDETLLDGHKDFEVDSEVLYHHMNMHGPKDTISKLHGAFSLTWYDKEESTINFCRNDERPLFFVFSEDNQTLFWASEDWMLYVALSKYGIKHGTIHSTAIMVHYEFAVPGNATTAFTKPKAIKYDEYVPPPPKAGNWFGRGRTSWEDYDDCTPIQQPPMRRKVLPNNIGNQMLPAPLRAVSKTPPSQAFKNSNIIFLCLGPVFPEKGKEGSPYIVGHIKGAVSIEVRAYIEGGSHRWNEMKKAGTECTGKVKAVSDYLLMDIRTVSISSVPTHRVVDNTPLEEEDKQTQTFSGFFPVGSRGISVDIDTYKQRVSKGCCICCSPITPQDAKQLVWICNDQEIICPGCKDTKMALEYIELM